MDQSSNEDLIKSAQNFSVEMLRMALRKGADISYKDELQNTALHLTLMSTEEGGSINDAVRYIKALLKGGINIDAKNNMGKTALHLAAEIGNSQVLDLLLRKGADVNVENGELRTPLHAATAGGCVEIVEKLLSRGARASCADVDNFTPLHLAARKGYFKIAVMLLKAGANVNSRAVDYLTPLHLAARNGHVKLIRYLLKKGADVYAETSEHLSVIHLAASNHKYEAIDALLNEALFHNVRDEYDCTFLHTIARNPPSSSGTDVIHVRPSLFKSMSKHIFPGSIPSDTLADVLKKHRIDLNNPVYGRITALHFAVGSNNEKVVASLLRAGGKANAQDYNGQTPMHLAVVNCNVKIFRLLLAHNPDSVKVQDNNGWTPLHLAVIMLAQQEHPNTGRVAFLHVLMEEVNSSFWGLRDKSNRTPFLLAMEAYMPEVAKTFFEKKLPTNDQPGSRVGVGTLSELHYAATFKDGAFVVKSLLDRGGVGINDRTEGGWTALSLAVRYESSSLVTLLNAGADSNIACDEGWTPLHLAATASSSAISDLLLHNRADIHAKLNDGNWLPLHLAIKSGRSATALTLLSGRDQSYEKTISGGWTALHLAMENGDIQLIDKLIKDKNADVNAKSDDYWTPLHLVAQNGNDGSLTKLLDAGADVNAKGNGDWTPLHLAAQDGHHKSLTKLLSAGADINAKTYDHWIPLHLAAQEGHHKSLTKLLDAGADVNAKGDGDWTPLHLAAQEGHHKSLTKLLDAGADVNAKSDGDWTPLHLAAQDGHHKSLTKLLDAGADVNAKSADYCTPLHLAAQNGHHKPLTKLLDAGADVNAKSADNWTPLHLAARNGHLRIVDDLILKNADITSLVNDLTPLRLAANFGHLKVALRLLQSNADIYDIFDQPSTLFGLLSEESALEAVRSLFTSNRIIEFPNKVTPLHLAAAAGSLPVISDLLKNGDANANPRTEDGLTPLHFAAQNGKDLAVDKLISLGANIDEKTLNGDTALHFAVLFNHPSVVTQLLTKGASVDDTCNRGFTPLSLAIMGEKLELARLLLKDGKADVNSSSQKGYSTPLHLSISVGDIDIFNLLVDYHADINCVGQWNLTPLHLAIVSGRSDFIYKLLNLGANINAKSTLLGLTPLHLAIGKSDYALIRRLLDNGADTEASLNVGDIEELPSQLRVSLNTVFTVDSINGRKPLHLVVELPYINVVTSLLDRGADINAIDAQGVTPLHLAAENNHIGVLRLLMAKGAIYNIKNLKGQEAIDLVSYGTACHQLLTAVTVMFSYVGGNSRSPNRGHIREVINQLAVDDIMPVLSARDSGNRKTALRQLYDNSNSRFLKSILKAISFLPPIGIQEALDQAAIPLDAKCVKRSHLAKRTIGSRGACIPLSEDQELEHDDVLGSVQISADSEKLLRAIKDLPKLERDRLIRLAEDIGVTGRFETIFHRLIRSRKAMAHLGGLGKISGFTMDGMMYKNILASFLNGNYPDVAINLGLIGGGKLLAKVAEVASLKGLNLLSEGKVLLGRSLRLASPFLARGTSVFIVYDMVNQIKEFRNGNQEALVGIVGDGVNLGIDVTEIGIGIAETLGVLEGISSVTGPIGAAIGAVVFVGTDIYSAVKMVEREDQLIHLTGLEKFTEGLRAFVHLGPSGHVQGLIEGKQANNLLVENAIRFLKEHKNIQRYVFPSDALYERLVQDSFIACLNSIITGNYIVGRVSCVHEEPVVRLALSNQALLNKKKEHIKWSRIRPDNPSEGELFCLPQGDDESVAEGGAYVCENAIGLSYSDDRTGNYTLVDLGDGDDKVVGFGDSPHIFQVGNGNKYLKGVDKDDVFVLNGNETSGELDGGDGIDILDLSNFAPNVRKVKVDLVDNMCIMDNQNIVWIRGIEKVLGRRERSDFVSTACNTKFVDGQGGDAHDSDTVFIAYDISDQTCYYKIVIIVRPNTIVKARSNSGEFNYIVLPSKGKAVVDTSDLLGGNAAGRHNFFFNSTVSEILGIYIQDVNQQFNYTVTSATFSFLSTNGKLESALDGRFDEEAFNITISDISVNASYKLSNEAEIKIGRKSNVYVLGNVNKSSEEVIREYLPVANRVSKISFFLQSLLSNETVVIGSGNHEVINNNPSFKSHLVGNGGENVYVIDSENDQVPEVVIYDVDKEGSIDTIDLRNLARKVEGRLELQVIPSGNDLLLRITVEKKVEGSLMKSEYCSVRLKDGVERYNKTHVIVGNVPMIIGVVGGKWDLKPQPLIIEMDKEIVVVTDHDVEIDNEIIIPGKGGDYKFLRSNDNCLIITNAFDAKGGTCSVVLSGFYEIPKMKTLSIKFADREIVLKDHEREINAAKNLDIVAREYEDQVYDEVFSPDSEFMESQDRPVEHRHRGNRHIGQDRHLRSASSGTRASSWLNGLLGWIRSSIGGLFYSRAALPETSVDGANYSGTARNLNKQYISQFSREVCISNNVGLGFFLLQSFLDKKYPLPDLCSITPEEALADTLNIVEEFKKILEKTAKQSGVLIKDVNFFKVYLDIAGHVRNERYSQIPNILYSTAEEAHPENKEFLTLLKENIEKMCNEQQIVNNGYQVQNTADPSLPKDIADNRPRSYLNDTTVNNQLQRLPSFS